MNLFKRIPDAIQKPALLAEIQRIAPLVVELCEGAYSAESPATPHALYILLEANIRMLKVDIGSRNVRSLERCIDALVKESLAKLSAMGT